MIVRTQNQNISKYLHKGKAIVVIGPRQVGKTSLMKKLSVGFTDKSLWLSGDDPEVRTLLRDISIARLKKLIGSHRFVIIDEAQRLHNAGLMLKLITDHFEDVQLLVTGSSAIDIAAEIKESLVGRKFEFPLFPLSFVEMVRHHGYLEETALLEHRLIYGYYPEVVKSGSDMSKKILAELVDGLMYKDLLSLNQIKKPALLPKLLEALALQLGNEVKYNEVAQLIGADPATVETYIDLLEKSFVLFRLPSLSRNARNEIKRGKKIYFYDNGIRNSIIKNFSPFSMRQDKGALWENFLINERRKRNAYHDHFCNIYFWRTTAQQEIDYIEDFDGKLHAFEFKWKARRGARFPKTFLKAYPTSETALIDRASFEDFIGLED